MIIIIYCTYNYFSFAYKDYVVRERYVKLLKETSKMHQKLKKTKKNQTFSQKPNKNYLKLTRLLKELVAPPDGPDPANEEQGQAALKDGHAVEGASPLALVPGASPLPCQAPQQEGRQRRSCCDVTIVVFMFVDSFQCNIYNGVYPKVRDIAHWGRISYQAKTIICNFILIIIIITY